MGDFTPDLVTLISPPYSTLLNFGTKCEGKFVPVDPTNNVATEHVQCTAAAGLG